MRILKPCRSCVLAIVTSVMLLVAGSAHADESDGAANRETSDADTFLWLGARLQFRFATLHGDSVNRGGPAMPDSSDVTLRRGRIKLGEHPFLPWIEVYSEDDFKEKSFLSEGQLHRQGIDDQFRGTARHLRGGYFQVGYFFHEWWERVPASLEIAGRIALVDPDAMRSGLKQEWTLGANWFLGEYGNKITTDVSYIGIEHQDSDASAMRFQVRWDISF